MSTTSYLGCGLAFLLAASCGFDGEATSLPVMDASAAAQHCKEALRVRFRSENGRSLQGSQGVSFVALSAQSGCDTVEDLQLQGARLVGHTADKSLAGADFAGSQLIVRDESGQKAQIEITAVEPDATDATGETSLYTLQFWDAESSTMKNACTPDKDGVAKALPLPGSWGPDGTHQKDSGAITFACTSGALAKCTRWGYRPWQTHQGVSLEAYHQACTRMVRADYCGDGTSYTKDGTTIDVYDNLGLLVRGSDPLLRFEATWTPAGAYCLSKQRWLELSTLLGDSCLKRFAPTFESSSVDADDVCYSRRIDLESADSLLSNRSY